MQDRFKFRVWDKRKNNYIKDFVFNFINKSPYITVEYFDNEYAYTHTFEEDEIIIEQCTGLRDKNGHLIYERDFLKDHNGIWQVLWDEKEAAFYLYNKKRDFYLSPFIGKFEVIGNIHENPELMEDSK